MKGKKGVCEGGSGEGEGRDGVIWGEQKDMKLRRKHPDELPPDC